LAVRAVVAEAQREAANLHFFLTMQTLIATLEARDPYTRRHSQNVAVYSVITARELGLPEAQVRDLYVGASLHDIGKVGTRDDILLKPGRLTAQEYKIIQQHPAIGGKILGPSSFPVEVAEMVLHHHERLDGTGYPDHLGGQDLNLAARICAVADVFDAMRSMRHYRPAHELDTVVNHLRQEGPSLFGADVVQAFLAALRSPTSAEILLVAQRPRPNNNSQNSDH